MKATTNAIPNEYDGPHSPAKKPASPGISLDYVNSNDAAVIDAGIRECIKGVRMSILAMGLGLAKIKAKGLHVDLFDREGKPFHSMNDYLEELCDEMQVERSTAHNWLYIGEAYTKYRNELERIDFTEADGPTKLPYVERALAIHKKQDVFQKIKGLTLKKFIEYARGEAPEVPLSKIRVVGNQIFVGKTPAVTLAEELDPKTRGYLEKTIVQAGEALEAGGVLYTTMLYDTGELRRFERAADRLKKELRIEYKGKVNKKKRP
jgi:hypothetical protein